MTIALDHLIVPARDAPAAAGLLARILGVPWAETGAGPFSPVYVSDSLTLDFDEVRPEDPIPVLHYAFHVDDARFDAIVGRLDAAGIPYRGTPHGANDMRINTEWGGRIVYWNAPDGHVWEALTLSYARRREASAGAS